MLLFLLLPFQTCVTIAARATFHRSCRLLSFSPGVPGRVDLPARNFPKSGPVHVRKRTRGTRSGCPKVARSRVDPAGSPRSETRSHVSYALRLLIRAYIRTYAMYIRMYTYTYIYVYLYIYRYIYIRLFAFFWSWYKGNENLTLTLSFSFCPGRAARFFFLFPFDTKNGKKSPVLARFNPF